MSDVGMMMPGSYAQKVMDPVAWEESQRMKQRADQAFTGVCKRLMRNEDFQKWLHMVAEDAGAWDWQVRRPLSEFEQGRLGAIKDVVARTVARSGADGVTWLQASARRYVAQMRGTLAEWEDDDDGRN